MKITPAAIRQHQFEKGFRGYEKEAVDAYLTALSQEWEQVLEENRSLKEKIERTEADYNKLKSLENTLYKTLQMAETTSQEMTSKAEEEASRRRQEVQQESDELLSSSRKQASMLLLDAETKSRYLIDEAMDELKTLERDYKAIEKYKDQLIAQIREYANDALEKVQRFEEKASQQGFEARYGELSTLQAEVPATTPPAPEEAAPFPEADEPVPAPVPAEGEPFPTDPEAPEPEAAPADDETPQPKASGSFFDQH
jgi:cell division initiation protein